MDEHHGSAGPGAACFNSTRWTVVLEAAQSRAEGGPEGIARATRCLEHEETALNKAEAFRTLRPFLDDDGVRVGLTYEGAARTLNIGLPALKTLIYCPRRRHTQLLREEVAQTVLNSNDVDAEVHALCEALVRAEGGYPQRSQSGCTA